MQNVSKGQLVTGWRCPLLALGISGPPCRRKVSMSHLRVLLIAAAVTFLFAPSLFSQAETGQITGTILDPTGAAIPNATVTVTDLATKAKRETQGSGNG